MQREGSSNYLEICPSGTRFYSIPNLNWEYAIRIARKVLLALNLIEMKLSNLTAG